MKWLRKSYWRFPTVEEGRLTLLNVTSQALRELTLDKGG